MANAEISVEEPTAKKSGKLGLIVGLILMVAAGGGGFFGAYTGVLPILGSTGETHGAAEQMNLQPIAETVFVELDALNVNIRSSSSYRMLRFASQVEVAPEYASEVEALKPRITDVMNTYLNAIEARRFEDPIAMIKLRSQLLRRIQIITGKERVQDLLIMEFILQ